MVKLTPEIIEKAFQRTNPVRERELDLRGYKIAAIESLGATLDQFDAIDFTDNDIRKLDGFPLLRRLKWLLLSNNRIAHIGEKIEECLPNLQWLILTNNNIQELEDIDPLAGCPNLEYLCLLGNPVCTKRNYRLYMIHRLPSVKRLDFQRVRRRERIAARKMFKSLKKAETAAAEAKKQQDQGQKRVQTFVPGEPLGAPAAKKTAASALGLSKEEVDKIKRAIAQAKTLEEVERLNAMLKAGQLPTTVVPQPILTPNNTDNGSHGGFE